MEEPPPIPDGAIWQQAEQSLEQDDVLASKLVGLQSSLVSWRANSINSVPDGRLHHSLRHDRYDVQLWLFGELRELFFEVKRTGRLCRFTVGDSDAWGHRLAPHADGYALFGAGKLAAGSNFTIDHAEMHRVPQDAFFDKTPGLMDSEQVYLGDTIAGIAISLNQMALTLRDNGQLALT